MSTFPHTVLFLDHTAKMSGGEIALFNLLGVLDKTRFRPVVLLASDGPLVNKLQAAGVETHLLPLPDSILNTRKDTLGARGLLGRARQVQTLFSYAAQVARWARTQNVQIIHANSLKSDIYGSLAGRMARIPVIWHVRDRIAEGYLPSAAAAGFRGLACLLPQMVVTNSHSTLQTLHLSPALQKSRVVYDGVPAAQFAPTQDAPPHTNAPLVSLFGRIAPWKGQHVFLQAAALVAQTRPDVRFRIVGAPLFGEHEYEQSLYDLTRELDLGERIEFTGFREDVPALMAETDIVVHASTLGEPFGQVVVEGMAAAKPVVATDGGALPEIVEHGHSGLLTPMGDAPALAAALEELLSNPMRARAIGQAGQMRVREQFTIERTARTMEAAYATVLNLPVVTPSAVSDSLCRDDSASRKNMALL